MIVEILKEYNTENWTFLNIEKKVLKSRYEWIETPVREVDLRYPWAILDDIKQLFHICVSYDSKAEFFASQKDIVGDKQLNDIHIKMIDSFCYPEEKKYDDLDTLINNSDDISLLNFIYKTLERALLWYDPEPCWPSDFILILRKAKSIVDAIEKKELVYTNDLKLKGVDLVSIDEHTHVFYKFQTICEQLQNGKIYDDLKTIAKQAHSSLVKSIYLCFEYLISSMGEITYEKRIESIIQKETLWCSSQIKK